MNEKSRMYLNMILDTAKMIEQISKNVDEDDPSDSRFFEEQRLIAATYCLKPQTELFMNCLTTEPTKLC